jgi:hypothetical protein
MLGPPPGAFMRGGHGPGEGARFFPIPGGGEDWTIPVEDGSLADDAEDRDAPPAKGPDDNSGVNEEGENGESS